MSCEDDYDSTMPEVTVSDRWVAVQFADNSPYLVLEPDGTVTERFTLPSDVAQLPLGGVA